jgi:hypothetical protein
MAAMRAHRPKDLAGPQAPGRGWPFAVLAIAAALNLYHSLLWWGNRLVDFHDFRQTQTAISTYYLVKEGFTLDYVTPVLGKPWSIPMEFPTYQLAVAALVRLTGYPLDQAGRLVSLLFFYLSLAPLYLLLGRIGLKAWERACVLAVVLSSPLYLFWSRTFMIESTALFFSLLAVLFAARYVDAYKTGDLAAGSASGVLAALTKVTTFGVYAFLMAAVLAAARPAEGGGRSSAAAVKRKALGLAALVGLPLLAAFAWAGHADSLKSMNPLAGFIVSDNMAAWNFGTLAQKASAAVWRDILWEIVKPVLGHGAVYALFLPAFFSKRLRRAAVLSSLAFLSGPAVFTNLYFVHEYYSYANALLLVVAVGLGLSALMERPRLRLVGLALIPLLMAGMYYRYYEHYVPMHRGAAAAGAEFYEAVKGLAGEDDVLLIYGLDWNPVLPYYTERRAIMDREQRPLDDPAMREAVYGTGRERITAMVLCGPGRGDAGFVEERARFFGLAPYPLVRSAGCDVYGKEARH